MPFDATTVAPETSSGFDPGSVAPESNIEVGPVGPVKKVKFQPATVQPEKKGFLDTILESLGENSQAVMAGQSGTFPMPVRHDPKNVEEAIKNADEDFNATPFSPEQIHKAAPKVGKFFKDALETLGKNSPAVMSGMSGNPNPLPAAPAPGNPAPAESKPDENAPETGVAEATMNFGNSLLTPGNMSMMGAGGVSKIIALPVEAYFTAQMGKSAGEKLGEASVPDPTRTPAQTAALWTSAFFDAAGAGLAGTGMNHTARDIITSAKTPAEAIPALTKAMQEAKSKEDAAAIADARQKYISWWEKQLDAQQQLRQSPQGAALLKQQLSTQERAQLRRKDDFLRAKIDEVKESISGNQLGGPEEQPAPAEEGKVEPTQPAGEAAIPAKTELSTQAQKVAAEEGEEFTPPAAKPRDVTPAGEPPVPGQREVVRGQSPEVTAADRAEALKAKPQTDQAAPAAPVEILPKPEEAAAPGEQPVFKQGDEVKAITSKGEEVDAVVSSMATGRNGRVRVTTKDGSTMFIPPERLKVAEAASAAHAEFDPSSVAPDADMIEATVEHPAEDTAPAEDHPVLSDEDKYARGPAVEPAAPAPKRGEKIAAPSPEAEPAIEASVEGEEPTPAGEKVVEAPAAVEEKVAAMPMNKKLKTQKEFLVKAARDAATDAKSSPEYVKDLDAITRFAPRRAEEAQAAQAQFFEKHGKDSITFHVPDDGTYKVPNIKEALTAFADKMDKKFGSPAAVGAHRLPQTAIPKMTPEIRAEHEIKPASAMASTRGAIDPHMLKALAISASGISGAAYGYSQGKTPEERIKKAIQYGAASAIGAYMLARFPEYLDRPGGAASALKAFKNAVMGKDLPNMRAVSQPATDAAFRVAGARSFGVAQGLNLAAKVLGDKWNDPVFAKKLGAVLVQEMQEAKLNQLQERLEKEKTPAVREQIKTQIANVKPVFDMPDNGGITSQADFDAALKDPEIKAAIERHKKLVQEGAQQAHTELGGKLAATGPNTGAFINTESIDPEGVEAAATAVGSMKGNLQNSLKRKSIFNRERTGTADQYEVDYNNQVARMASGNAERVALKDYYDTLEKEKLAQRLPPGDRPADAANYTKERTRELSSSGKVEDTWIRKDIFGEHRQLMNTDSPIDSLMLNLTAKAMNTIQLTSLTDPVFHVANIISAIAGSQGGKSVWADIGRKVPGVDVADAMTRVGAKLKDVAAGTPEIREAAAQVARIGAMREGHPGVVAAVDKAGRLVMNDLYDHMAERGLVDGKDEGARRDFINQVGQYNTRLMGKTKAFMKEAGFSPFIVAGQNFNRLAIRRITGMPGVKAVSGGALGRMVTTNLAGLAVTAATTMMTNYLVSGKVGGPPGTPVGAVGWMGKDDQGKDVLRTVDPLKWTNARRGLRITGLNSTINGLKEGRDLNHSGGQAIEDMKNGMLGPWAGPAVNAVNILFTGESMSGFQEAEKANPLDHTNAPTLDQAGNNAKAAATALNPHIAAAFTGGTRGQKDPGAFSVAGAAKGVVKSLGKSVGYGEAKPGNEDHGPAETALYTKEKTQFDRTTAQQVLADKWDKLPPKDRAAGMQKLVNDSLAAVHGEEMSDDQREEFSGKIIDDVVKEIESKLAQGDNPTDHQIKDLGVQDGSRARFLTERYLARPTQDARTEFLKQQLAKGNLTDEVLDQILVNLQRRKFKQ